ncbi:ER membrane protein complex subunit 8 [Octopus sinensis]|uniref:ER membrane protein complex subunit 8 n=1 Tax=Octopus sinensis TaxID=2607531 RepID=A0A6P7T8B3_9MOLL|nr:ER membrane protein complex subunit 8 [Octopus sinensis]
MVDYNVSLQAYCKILSHAAKYPHSSVNGVLLAEDTKVKDSNKCLKMVDTIPLFHVCLGLTPMLEFALTLIDIYCKSKGLVIGGYYQANENYCNSKPDNVAYLIGKKIQEYFADSCIFMVNNNKVSPQCVSEAYKIYLYKDNMWKEADKKQTVEEETLLTASQVLETPAIYRKLMDFDNHFDDIKNDWRNIELNEILTNKEILKNYL